MGVRVPLGAPTKEKQMKCKNCGTNNLTKTTNKISKRRAVQILNRTQGKEFKISFLKKDGVLRAMRCTLPLKTQTIQNITDAVTVLDLDINQFRSFKLSNLRVIKFNKKVYHVN